MKRFITHTVHQTLLRISSKNDEMGRACGTFAVEEKFIQGFGAETCRVNVENLGVDGT
jgi:hypothetical protein